jgi:hypothetical protein
METLSTTRTLAAVHANGTFGKYASKNEMIEAKIQVLRDSEDANYADRRDSIAKITANMVEMRDNMVETRDNMVKMRDNMAKAIAVNERQAALIVNLYAQLRKTQPKEV